ncbi:MAG TPA: SIS domain-containing protein [Patescibacteria group bacterium]|nr:SIS domain-containing protein [Patescibacteria group bacterium]
MTEPVTLDDYFVPGEIRLQPAVIRRVLEVVDPLLEPIARAVVGRDIRDIVMTGCGDSLFSAMAATFSFVRFSGRMTAPLHALEYSRGFYRASGPGTLLCALSYSGETRRTLEAVIAARSRGASVLALTADASGSIAQLADHLMPNVSPRESERSNCRTGSYQAAYMGLVLLAAHIAAAERPGDSTVLDGVRREMAALATGMERSLEAFEQSGREAATVLRSARAVYFVGGGEAHAAALYGAAKLYETSSLPAVPQETEQFAHCEIFSLEPDSVVIVIALRGPFYDRAVEVADAIRQIGAHVIGVANDPAFSDHADLAVTFESGGFDELASSLAVVPLQWMAVYDAVRRGQNPDLVRHKAVNSPLIRGVPIWDAEAYEAAESVLSGPTGGPR